MSGARAGVDTWLHPTDKGLYCAPGDFYIDPHRVVGRAVVTHGHSDHARPGHGAVLATSETIAVMKLRLGAKSAGAFQAADPGAHHDIGGVHVSLVPAGHVLGSAQVVLTWRGSRVVVTGDYKRAADPTCAPFEPVACDLLVTEATFALPVYRHEPADGEVARLLQSMTRQPERTHLLCVYSLGKCQRMLQLLRMAGYDRPVWLHGALLAMTRLYESFGHDFGDIRPVETAGADEPTGGLVLAPPSAQSGEWLRCLRDPVTVAASGWMRVRARARQSGAELPLVVSDHADWPELLTTIAESGAEEIWITHGRHDALVHELTKSGRRARALSLVGRTVEGD